MKTKKLKKIKLLLSMCILSLVFALCYQNVNAYVNYDYSYRDPTNVNSIGLNYFNGGATTTNTRFDLSNSFNVSDFTDNHILYYCYIISDSPLKSFIRYDFSYSNQQLQQFPVNQSFDVGYYESLGGIDINDEIELQYQDGEDHIFNGGGVYLGTTQHNNKTLYLTIVAINQNANFNVSDVWVAFGCEVGTNLTYYYSNLDYFTTYGDMSFMLNNYDNFINTKDTYTLTSDIQNVIDKAEIQGYNRGLKEGIGYSNDNFYSLLDSVASTPLHIFSGLFDFEILGVNMKGFIVSLLCIAMGCLVIKLIIKFMS